MMYVFQGILVGAWRNYRGDTSSFIRSCWYSFIYPIQLMLGCLIFGRKVLLLFLVESWLREIDDQIDKEYPLPRKGLLSEKLSILHQSVLRKECDDPGLIAVCSCAESINIDIRGDLIVIIGLMKEEFEWRQSKNLPTPSQRMLFAQKQDSAVLRLIVRAFKGDVEMCEQKIMSLGGVLTRTDWLYDLNDDVLNGCFLMPIELSTADVTIDKMRASVARQDLQSIQGFSEWYRSEVKDVENLWKLVREKFRQDCQGMFPRRFEGKFFYWAIFRELEGEFRQARERYM